jgi:hypothetical protein
VEEFADMPSCNLFKTIYNKWLQESSNHGNDLFAATCGNKIRAVVQMTNYRAYLKNNLPRTCLSKQQLRLRAATRSDDPKKIVDATN